MCSYESGLSQIARSRFLQPGCRYAGWKFYHILKHFSPVTGMKAGWIPAVQMASSCIACGIFLIISIVEYRKWYAKAMKGAKVIIFAFRHVCFAKLVPVTGRAARPLLTNCSATFSELPVVRATFCMILRIFSSFFLAILIYRKSL